MDQTNHSETEKKVDRWLDAALAHYNRADEAEPRMGLEARVLATLDADRRECEASRYRWPWRWTLAAGLAAVLIVVIARRPWSSTQQPTVKPSIGTVAAMTTTSSAHPGPKPPVLAVITSNPSQGGARRSKPHFEGVVSEAPAPRLAQFPAPRPLSEQERLLVAMANNTPPEQLEQDAALQQRLRREVEEARMSGGGTLEPRGK
jgi:hypothetical protein